MALLTLKNVGKIYVSDSNVAVGIRGVDLSFDRGEFVAVTGKSGSGKSTLLNVISGMDTYEEGELYIEDSPTSHYLQSDWEEYREKYISFIFQDYNIIDSFTVLENVELALMHIEDKNLRRERALELISRVGLMSHVKHKGSKLSGGQKQRTVIARALAKDSPIILADEPTGNLDAATSKEIIQLLQEVSRDKLLIVVTHNFEEVESCATRHVRIFDGAVESDRVLSGARADNDLLKEDKKPKRIDKKEELRKEIKNGATLGLAIFKAKPRLSLFLCLLMIVGSLGIFSVTSACGDATAIFDKHYMFSHIDGRVVVAKQSGEVISEDEVKTLAEKSGAESYLRYDILLDSMGNSVATYKLDDDDFAYGSISVDCVYGKDYGKSIIGRYPEKSNEVLLNLPIWLQSVFGKDEILRDTIELHQMVLDVVGVKYYYDNNLTAECLFTPDGFKLATAAYYVLSYSSLNATATVSSSGIRKSVDLYNIVSSFDIEDGKIYVGDKGFLSVVGDGKAYSANIDLTATYREYNYNYGNTVKSMYFSSSYDESSIVLQRPDIGSYDMGSEGLVVISDEVLLELAEGALDRSYRQASLFFENDRAAHKAAEELKALGYVAVPSDTEYEPDAAMMILSAIGSILLVIVWCLAIVFLAFFINLCAGRALGAFKGDMAIMRSMGIPVRVIRIGMYIRMLLSLIPAFILVAVSAVLIFASPLFNQYFTYLYAWQYALIYLGMLLLTVRVTHLQIRRLFGESVKKSLKGGQTE